MIMYDLSFLCVLAYRIAGSLFSIMCVGSMNGRMDNVTMGRWYQKKVEGQCLQRVQKQWSQFAKLLLIIY